MWLTVEVLDVLCDARTDGLFVRRIIWEPNDVKVSSQLPTLSWLIDMVDEVEWHWLRQNSAICRARRGSASLCPYLLSTWLRIWVKHSSRCSWSGCIASMTRERWITNAASSNGICWAMSSRSSRIEFSSSGCSSLYLKAKEKLYYTNSQNWRWRLIKD